MLRRRRSRKLYFFCVMLFLVAAYVLLSVPLVQLGESGYFDQSPPWVVQSLDQYLKSITWIYNHVPGAARFFDWYATVWKTQASGGA